MSVAIILIVWCRRRKSPYSRQKGNVRRWSSDQSKEGAQGVVLTKRSENALAYAGAFL